MVTTWQDHLEMAADELFRPLFNAVDNAYLPTNIHETDSKFVLEVSVPGVDQKDVKVEYANKTLTVEATRPPPKDSAGRILREIWNGTTSRKFYLTGVDASAITAKFNNGLLVIEVPKIAPDKRVIKIV